MLHAWLLTGGQGRLALFVPSFLSLLSVVFFPFSICFFSPFSLFASSLYSPFLSAPLSFSLFTTTCTSGPKFCAELTFWAEVDIGNHTVRLPMASCLLQWSRSKEEFQCRILCSLIDSPSCSSFIFFSPPEKETRPNHIWYHGLRGRVGMHSSDFDVGNFLLASWPGRSTGLGIRSCSVRSAVCHLELAT